MNAAHRRSQQLAAQRSRRMHGGGATRSLGRSPFQQMLDARASGLGLETRAGIAVNEDMAMKLSAVFCAVRTRSELVGSLPVHVYERKGTGVKDAKVHSHPVAEVLNRPNRDQTPMVFREQRDAHQSLWGNNYCLLNFEGADLIDATPLHPNLVEIFHNDQERDGRGRPRLMYQILDPEGRLRIATSEEILHVPGLGFNGLVGFSVIRLAAESMGIHLALDRMAATFFSNGAKPSMVVTTPEYLDDDQFRNLNRDINTEYSGDNSFRAMLLEGGATPHFASMPLNEAQFLESRKFQGEEICARWFKLPPHLCGFLDNAHFNNVTEQNRSLVMHTLTPLLVRDEQEWNRKAFRPSERGRFYVKYNVDGLLRGDLKTRYEAHRNALFAGWQTVNRVREMEDEPPIEGGDELPRPQAIWGKPTPAGGSTEGGDRTDPRLRALTVRTIDSLQAAETIQAERHAGQNGFAERVREFYDRHERKLIERLSPLGGDALAVLDHCRQHRDQLLEAGRSADPGAAVALCIEGWREDPRRLADQLLNSRSQG